MMELIGAGPVAAVKTSLAVLIEEGSWVGVTNLLPLFDIALGVRRRLILSGSLPVSGIASAAAVLNQHLEDGVGLPHHR